MSRTLEASEPLKTRFGTKYIHDYILKLFQVAFMPEIYPSKHLWFMQDNQEIDQNHWIFNIPLTYENLFHLH